METAAQGGQGIATIWWLFLAGMFIFFLFTGRSQKKTEQERLAKVSALQKGDGVILQNGIVGTVAGFKDNAIEVKIAEGIKLTVLKSGIIGFVENKTPATKGGAK